MKRRRARARISKLEKKLSPFDLNKKPKTTSFRRLRYLKLRLEHLRKIISARKASNDAFTEVSDHFDAHGVPNYYSFSSPMGPESVHSQALRIIAADPKILGIEKIELATLFFRLHRKSEDPEGGVNLSKAGNNLVFRVRSNDPHRAPTKDYSAPIDKRLVETCRKAVEQENKWWELELDYDEKYGKRR